MVFKKFLSSDFADTDLSDGLKQMLLVKARSRRLTKGESLFLQGSAPDAVYFVKSGAIQLSNFSSTGREAVLGIAEAGMWFGELTLIIQQARVHDAKALVPTELMVVSKSHFFGVVNDNKDFLKELLHLVCRRYKWAIERIEATILKPVPVRLADRLLAEYDMAKHIGGSSQTELKLSQEQLGRMLGASRQTVNRLLKELESEKILTLTYGRIHLHNLSALRLIVAES
ncbi:MAG: Crp/Fnr family transcriptional regulator [Betaproteobacteria bacterium]|jgi:CRP/FNR family transcriptional regulator, cyclic AMP receptor protein